MPVQDPRDRLKEYTAEFVALLNMNATKAQLRNGANGKHGLNHLIEAFTMLPDEGQSAEFRIRE
jgi:hypothetical protein